MVTYTILLSALAATAFAAERLGGIDINSACRAQYGNGYYSLQRGNGCSDWRCVGPTGVFFSVDTPAACGRQYGGNTYAYCTTGAYDWACFRN